MEKIETRKMVNDCIYIIKNGKGFKIYTCVSYMNLWVGRYIIRPYGDCLSMTKLVPLFQTAGSHITFVFSRPIIMTSSGLWCITWKIICIRPYTSRVVLSHVSPTSPSGIKVVFTRETKRTPIDFFFFFEKK